VRKTQNGKLKIETQEPCRIPEMSSGAPEGLAVPVAL